MSHTHLDRLDTVFPCLVHERLKARNQSLATFQRESFRTRKSRTTVVFKECRMNDQVKIFNFTSSLCLFQCHFNHPIIYPGQSLRVNYMHKLRTDFSTVDLAKSTKYIPQAVNLTLESREKLIPDPILCVNTFTFTRYIVKTRLQYGNHIIKKRWTKRVLYGLTNRVDIRNKMTLGFVGMNQFVDLYCILCFPNHHILTFSRQ
mmetsp:Transcript_44342/g.70957  ORF Transcript_44342/g.70957 Transcript_44342/m.70957 type:complete len:203 (+) Transcript_44342:2961-3569(+)